MSVVNSRKWPEAGQGVVTAEGLLWSRAAKLKLAGMAAPGSAVKAPLIGFRPCPTCGGADRFQYTDRFGNGNYHWRGCRAGGGLKLRPGRSRLATKSTGA